MGANKKAGGNFNRIAPVYDALAFIMFGHQLQRAQQTFLDRIPPHASVVIIGGGTGWLLEQLLLQNHLGQILYLETSCEMVMRASRRLVRKPLTGSVEFRVGDETALLPGEQFDVLITPFVLDLFTEHTLTTTFIPRLVGALKPTGCWLVTDFVHSSVGWQRILLWAMIRFFRLTAGIQMRELANWQQCLLSGKLCLRARASQVRGMVSAEVWSL